MHAPSLSTFARTPAGFALGAAGAGVVIGLLLNPARKIGWQAHEALAGDWVGVLKAEHRMVELAFEAALKTKERQPMRRATLFKKINWALLKHGVQEETSIYPALRETGAAEEGARHLYEEHADIKTRLFLLQSMDVRLPEWLGALEDLRDLIEGHVREEEDELFPMLHERLSRDENRRLTMLVHREGVRLA